MNVPFIGGEGGGSVVLGLSGKNNILVVAVDE